MSSSGDVENAGLVLEREEDESFRGAGALAADHKAGQRHALAVAPIPLQLQGGPDTVRRQQRPEVPHGVSVERQSCEAVVGVGDLEA